MSDPLAWIAAIGGAAATVGTFRTEATARWQALVEQRRNDAARRENDLHRQRFAEVWNWWHDLPDGPERTAAARWYYEWTGARPPLSPGADGPLPLGVGSPNADEAYRRYLDYLAVSQRPGLMRDPRTGHWPGSGLVPARSLPGCGSADYPVSHDGGPHSNGAARTRHQDTPECHRQEAR